MQKRQPHSQMVILNELIALTVDEEPLEKEYFRRNCALTLSKK